MVTNWAGNVEFQAVRLAQPTSVEELQELVAGSEAVRALGTGHSFSPVADGPGVLVRLDRLPFLVSVDPVAGTATVGAGLRYSDVVGALNDAGVALANLASLPHIGVAGAVATGTHGSGLAQRSLSAAVVGLTLVTADGSLLSLSRSDVDFPGAVVALGKLGVVVSLTLAVEPAFQVAQVVRVEVPLDEIEQSFDQVFGAAYSVSAFTRYDDGLANVFLKQRPSVPGTGWLGGRAASGPVHPIPSLDPAACTPQLGVPGPWHERLPHFRAEFTPSVGDELQSEFFVDRSSAAAAIAAVRSVASAVAPVLHIAELRTVAGDDLWLSPAYGRDSACLHFTWHRSVAAVLPALAAVESVLLPLGARPHWGKLTTEAASTFLPRYPRAEAFEELRHRLDPTGTFRSTWA